MRWLPLGIFLIALPFGLGCTDDDVTAEEQLAGTIAYDSLLEAAPDSVQRAAPIDRLFLTYDALQHTEPDTSGAAAWVDATLASMTLDEKIGQLFIIHLDEPGTRTAVEAHHVGGLLVPRLLDAREVFDHVRQLQPRARVPLFFGADYERGVGRFNDALTELPSNMAIGATRDTLFAAAAGRLTAIEARAIGVNLLFAPVVDVNNNPDNPIINIRSYGEDPELVGRMAASFVREAQSRALLTTLKHFPGHGDTNVDSHARMGVVEGDRAELERIELRPYRIVLERSPQPAAVMTAHLWIRALEPEPVPATFSAGILTDLLRADVGFDGIVITDDVRMGALQSDYDVTERILRPLEAGADVVLTPPDLPQAIRIVKEAVRGGRITQRLLEDSVRRILTAKATAGLHTERLPNRGRLQTLMAEPRGAHIAQAIADRAITLLKSPPSLPLRPESARIAMIHLTNYRGSESIAAAMDLLNKSIGIAESARFEDDPPERDVAGVLERAGSSDVVVLALYLRLQAGRGEAGLFAGQTDLVHRLLEMDVPVVLVTFGNPDAASAFREADGIVVAYDQALQTVYAAARVLRGRQPAPGRLPISVEPFAYGSGTDGVK